MIKHILISFLVLNCASVFANVGYVDFDQVLKKTKGGKSITSRFEKEVIKKQGELQKQEKSIQKEKDKLDAEINLLSDSEKRNRAQKFQMRIAGYERLKVNFQKELSEYQQKLVFGIVKNLKPVVRKIAKEKKYTAVKRLSPDTLWVDPSLDITKEVIKAYNKKY